MLNPYSSKKNYIEYINDNFEKTGIILPGLFYSFIYVVDKSIKYDTLKWYDLMPLVFCINYDMKTKNMIGLNLHHIPVISRRIFLQRLSKLFREDWSEGNRLVVMNEYKRLYNMFKKGSEYSVRQYDTTKIINAREIPTPNVEEAVEYFGKTHVGVTINEIYNEYTKYRIK
jgi:hypothetical protein